MRIISWLVIGLIALLASVVAAETGVAEDGARAGREGEAPCELDDRTFDTLLERVLPDPAETEYGSIRWRARFHEAVAEATERRLPVLLWAMNGHPLGCT